MLKLNNLVSRIENALMTLAGAALAFIMLIVVADVILRYFFSSPLSWSHEIISMYLVTQVFFLALAGTFRDGGHIKVDLFDRFQNTWVFSVAEILAICMTLLFFCLMLQQMAAHGWQVFLSNDILDGAIPWPTWPPYFLGTVGVGLLILRMALILFKKIILLSKGEIPDRIENIETTLGHRQ
ncbi:MAG: TRAP transporter small permease [Betaproteobacteria bacterium]|nr:TRAP transporter small permease [Betaproteobacteria bacterium]